MDYHKIELAARNLGYTLKTTERQYEAMVETPSMRNVKLECDNGHTWYVRASVLLYKGTICPDCTRFKCQSIMRLLMESIFSEASGMSIKFPETSLSRAFGVSSKKVIEIDLNGKIYSVKVGLQRFDGYAVVEINGKTYKIAFEYDGSYHDNKKHFYYTHYGRDFYRVVARDTVKSQEANNHETIIIRLKEIRKFDIHTVHLFQQEIIRQFEELTGEKLSINHIYTFDFGINKLIKAKQIDNFIGNK